MKTILCLHSSADLYGSDRSLLRLVTGGLDFRFMVVVPYEGPLCAALREKGVAVRVHPLAVIRRRYFTPWGLLFLAGQLIRQTLFLRRLIREEGVDLVMANTTAVLGGEWAAAWAGRPYLQYVREIVEKPRLVARFLSWRARWATRVLCVSEGTRRNFTAQDPAIADRTFVLNNGIEVRKFEGGKRAKVRGELGIGEDTVLVGAIGRISPFKGMDFLVDAAAHYLKSRPEARVRFLIVGSAFRENAEKLKTEKLKGCGEISACQHVSMSAFATLLPAERELLGRIDGTGFGDRISWQPFREDVADVLAALDVFVLPSMLPDPLPTVVLEAMAARKPVIGTRMGGVPEMVVEQTLKSGKTEKLKGEEEVEGQEQTLTTGAVGPHGGASASDAEMLKADPSFSAFQHVSVSAFTPEPTGILVEAGDVAGLAGALARLVEDAGLRGKMGLAGAVRCRDHFSVEKYLSVVPRHLQECIADSDGGRSGA